MAEQSWRQVAAVLAERLRHQALVECPHSGQEEDPDNCPFCADRAAYRTWERKEAGGRRG